MGQLFHGSESRADGIKVSCKAILCTADIGGFDGTAAGSAALNRFAFRVDILCQFRVHLATKFLDAEGSAAIIAMPANGSQPSSSNRAIASRLRRLPLPFLRPLFGGFGVPGLNFGIARYLSR